MRTFILVAFILSFMPMALANSIDLSHSGFEEKIATDSNTIIIDVRTAREFTQGRVPNSINIPHSDILEDLSLLDEYKGKDLVFYCRSGYRAGRVTDLIEAKNYIDKGNVYHLDGDMLGWQAANKPVEK